MKVCKKKNTIRLETIILTYLISVIAYLSYVLIICNLDIGKSYSQLIFLLNWLGIFSGIFILKSWNKLTGDFFTPYTIFILFLLLFNYGQCLMWAFGIHVPTEIGKGILYPGFGVANSMDIVKAQMLTLVCIFMFHSGAMSCYKGTGMYKLQLNSHGENEIEDTITLKAIYWGCLVIAIIVIPVTLYYTYTDFKVAQQYGYSVLYYSDFSGKGATVLGLLTRMFFPSLIGLLIGSKYNKKVQIMVYITFLIYLVMNLLAGDRGSWIYKIFILVWLSNKCYKPINFKITIKYIVVAIMGVYITSALVNLRDVGLANITINQLFNSMSVENSPIVSSIFEMGGSMQPTIVLQKYDWNIWPYANTYLLAILGMVTNKIIYLLNIPFALLSSWFSQEYLGISWGAGFSIIAEALMNVGPLLAPWIMIIQGYIIGTLIYTDKTINYKQKPMKILFAASSLNYFIQWTRNELHIQAKDWFYGVVLLCIFIYLLRAVIKLAIKKC